MPNRDFRRQLEGQLFRERLGEELAQAKRNGDFSLVVSYGSSNIVYAQITVGAQPRQCEAECGLHNLIRTHVLETLRQYVRIGHENFFRTHNLNARNRADSYFILYRKRLCDLKAVARVSLGLAPGMNLIHSPTVAQAVDDIGFTYVHFLDEPVNDCQAIHLMETTGHERDGLRYGRSGEGKNHKRLRKWVKKNPGRIVQGLCDVKAKTEEPLLSGDRVDVVYYAEGSIVVIEVKSRDSNWDDLRRGIYQCIKYKAVMRAQMRADDVDGRSVCALLVTENELSDDLRDLASTLNINCRVVRRT